jgi:protein-S-isoprenylcysteine O-methyltransferase Ste14
MASSVELYSLVRFRGGEGFNLGGGMSARPRANPWIPIKVAGTVALICLACDGLAYILDVSTITQLYPNIPAWVLSSLGWFHLGVGALLFVSALLRLGIRAASGAPDVLVTDGPFRYVRSPMYGGIAFMLVGSGLLLDQVSLLVAMLIWLAVARQFCLDEDQLLSKKFGRSYSRYRKSTPLLLPHVGRIMMDFLYMKKST